MDKTAGKVGVQFLDRDRNPIQDAKVKLEYSGRSEEQSTGQNGRLADIVTNATGEIVKIFIARPDGSWKQITEVLSEARNKLVTLVSPKIKIEAETKEHPKDSSGKPVADTPDPGRKPVSQPEQPKDSTAQGKTEGTYGDDKGTKSQDEKSPNGAPVKKVTKDQAQFEFLDEYTGEVLTDADFKWAATELKVEEAIIRAINEVEAAGKGFVKLYNRQVPKILYERHYFHTIMKGKFTAANPDISWKQGYYQQGVKYIPTTFTCVDSDGKSQTFNSWRTYSEKKDKALKDKVMTGKELFNSGKLAKEKDAYSTVAESYKRLSKAYALDKDAALRSCSWGAFQIMGDHYNKMKYKSVTAFVKAMSRSEREHIRAFVLFCQHVNPSIIKSMQPKKINFEKLAAGFNGPSYKNNRYDELLSKSYQKWSKR